MLYGLAEPDGLAEVHDPVGVGLTAGRPELPVGLDDAQRFQLAQLALYGTLRRHAALEVPRHAVGDGDDVVLVRVVVEADAVSQYQENRVECGVVEVLHPAADAGIVGG